MGVLSCITCRKRKVACDRNQPACSRCLLSGKECQYRARIYRKATQQSRVAAFEARLVQMESQLFQRETPPSAGIGQDKAEKDNVQEDIAECKDLLSTSHGFLKPERRQSFLAIESNLLLEQEALPEASLQQYLIHIYFQRVHPSAPMIHKSRFFQSLTGNPSRVPSLALRYAMWAIAASETTEHQDIAENLYSLSRKHAIELEMKGAVSNLSASCAQCWYLLATYEASRAYFTRAWVSVGRCVRLVQMMAFHRLDGEEQILPQGSWTEMEERRRIFWATYSADRWASTISGHPLSIKDEDISTNLPSSEEAFEYEIEEVGSPLRQLDGAESIAYLSPFAGSVFTTALLGRYLHHVHAQDNHLAANTDSKDWVTHRQIDTSLSHTFMNLPAHLLLSSAAEDVNIVFLHLNLHVTVILLHQMAIKKVTKHGLDPSIRQRSFQRCLVSSVAIKNIIYSVKDLKGFSAHIWITFCIYVAAGVFIDDMTTTRHSSSSAVDLGLLLIALKVIGARQTILNFFARRLESDISRAGVSSHIPADLRGIAGISITSRTVNSSRSSRDAYCSIPDDGLYK